MNRVDRLLTKLNVNLPRNERVANYTRAGLTQLQKKSALDLTDQVQSLQSGELTFAQFARQQGVGRSTTYNRLSNAAFKNNLTETKGIVVLPNGRHRKIV